MNMDSLPGLAVIAGPTASGKSALALRLAESVGGTIVNADALQVYADLRILTARPNVQDEERAPHRLFGHRDAADPYDVALWAAEARGAVAEVAAAGGLPILVGGTGLYLRALLDGLAPVPPIDEGVRTAVRALKVADAWVALEREDAGAAVRLRPTDRQRIARALEVVRSTGRPLSGWQAERSGGIGSSYDVRGLVAQPPPAVTAERIEVRLRAMFSGGAAEEVAALLRRPDLPRDAAVWRAIGAREIAAWLEGSSTLEEALAATATASRAYAKRQRTWLRHQVPTEWVRVEGTEEVGEIEHWANLERAGGSEPRPFAKPVRGVL